MAGGMRLPSDAFQPRPGPVPADLSARGQSLFPELPAPTSVKDNPPVPALDLTRFCEAFTLPVTFTGAGNVVALARTSAKRAGLLIVNTNVAAGIFYVFDNEASNTNGVPIVSGGNRLFDVAVPQGNLNIFSSGAGLVIVEYLLLSNY